MSSFLLLLRLFSLPKFGLTILSLLPDVLVANSILFFELPFSFDFD